MELCDIEKLVNDKNNKINKPYIRDEGYDFCKKFLENNKIASIHGFMDMDIYDACKCLRYLSSSKKYSIDDCCQFIESYRDYFEELDVENFDSFADMVFSFASNRKLDEVTSYLRESSSIVAKSKLVNLNYEDLFVSISEADKQEKNKWYRKLLKEMRETQEDIDLAGLLEEARDNSDCLSTIMGLIEAQKRMKSDKTRFLKVFDEETSRDPNSTYAKKCLASYYKGNYKTKEMLSALDIISSFVSDESYAEINHNSTVKKEVECNDRALELLKKSAKNSEITDARSIVKKIKDADIKRAILKYIYEHNMKYYKVLNEDLDEVRKNTATEYLNELKMYNIIVGVDVVKQFMYNRFDDFKEILKHITKLPVDEKSVLSILRFTNLEIVNKVDEYIKEGFLNIDFVSTNISIFDPNSKMINLIDNNLELLMKYNINPKLFIDIPDILLSDSGVLETNIKYLEVYEYKGSMRTTSDYNFLLDDKLIDKMDRLIELGYATLLEKDLGLLNTKHLKRLELIDEMNIPISDVDSLRDVLFSDTFIVKDEEIDSYLYNVLDYKEKFDFDFDIDYLERNRFDKRRYLLNGVSISSNKVKRLLEEGKDMYDAIFHNMIINSDKYDNLKNKLRIRN